MKLRLINVLDALAPYFGDDNRTRMVSYVNQATEILLYKGPTQYSIGTFKFCLQRNCITWPRQIETVEGIAICGVPVNVANSPWYEFLPTGAGMRGSCTDCNGTTSENINWCGCSDILVPRGTAVTFQDITPSYKIRVLSSQNETGTPRILLQGYDENNQWIRTFDATLNRWVEGEFVNISSTFVLSTKKFSSLVSVQKDESIGVTYIYEDHENGTIVQLAQYEWDECSPNYTRSYVNFESKDSGGNYEEKSVYIRAKLRFSPVKNNTDWVMIGNLAALKSMISSIKNRENNMTDLADSLEAEAVRRLNEEERHFNPVGGVKPLNFSQNFGGNGREILSLY